eukprot:3705121-Prymnesium_polylepis.2
MLSPLRAAHSASGEKARVVHVASRLEKRSPPLLRGGALDLASCMASEGYTLGRAYSVSKVCQIASAFELQRRHESFLAPLHRLSCAVEPSLSRSDDARHGRHQPEPLLALLEAADRGATQAVAAALASKGAQRGARRPESLQSLR